MPIKNVVHNGNHPCPACRLYRMENWLGDVTHALVNDPTIGYGFFVGNSRIDTMIEFVRQMEIKI